jgi:hypothetical protein
VGDSRAYLVRPDRAELLTIDDSLVAEQSAEGPIRTDPKSASTRWLGARPAPARLGEDWRAAIGAHSTTAERVRALRWWQRVLGGHRLWAGIVLLGLVVVAVVAGVDAAACVAGILGFRAMRGSEDSLSRTAAEAEDTGSTRGGGSPQAEVLLALV